MLNKDKPVTINIDDNKCTKCGMCVRSCHGYLVLENNEIKESKNSLFGCIQCGHCMMTCPNDAMGIEGEAISKNDIVKLAPTNIDFDGLHPFFLKRRSIREFKDEEVSNETIEKTLKAASTSAISIPPSEVKVLVINGKDKVQEFADDIVNSFESFLKKSKHIKLLKPFMKKEQYKLFVEFVIPLVKETAEARKKGVDILFYNAPAVILFYQTGELDKEDSIIAATTATIAAEALGLGTCFIGSAPPTINRNEKLRAKYGILKTESVSMAFILGVPKKQFTKGINRSFKEVNFY